MKKIVEIKTSLDKKEASKYINMVMHHTIEGMKNETDEENLEILGKIAGSLYIARDKLLEKPKLSREAFTVLDHFLEDQETFNVFSHGKHHHISSDEVKKQLDELYDYWYGEED